MWPCKTHVLKDTIGGCDRPLPGIYPADRLILPVVDVTMADAGYRRVT